VGVKSEKFGLNFRPQSPSTHCHSETMQDMCKLKCALKAQIIAQCKLQIWYCLVHTTLRTPHFHM